MTLTTLASNQKITHKTECFILHTAERLLKKLQLVQKYIEEKKLQDLGFFKSQL